MWHLLESVLGLSQQFKLQLLELGAAVSPLVHPLQQAQQLPSPESVELSLMPQLPLTKPPTLQLAPTPLLSKSVSILTMMTQLEHLVILLQTKMTWKTLQWMLIRVKDIKDSIWHIGKILARL